MLGRILPGNRLHAMLKEFEVIKYRGLENLNVGPLRRVNLVTGPNGVGKTSLSEALWLYHGRYNPAIVWSLHVQRRRVVEQSPLANLGDRLVELSGLEDDQQFGVRFEFEELVSALPSAEAETDEASPRDLNSEGFGNISSYTQSQYEMGQGAQVPVIGSLRMTYDPDTQVRTESHELVVAPTGRLGISGARRPPRRPVGIILNRGVPFPIATDTIERFSTVVAQGAKKDLLEILTVIQPTIKDLEILSRQNTPSLWADVGAKELLPVEALGGGIVRLLSIFVSLFAARGGFFTIDEVENGIHHSALPVLWQQIIRMCRLLDVQFVAITHSLECARAAATASTDGELLQEFALHQMHSLDGVRRIETYTDDKLMAALELGYEVR